VCDQPLSSLSREPRAALERGGNALRDYVVKHMEARNVKVGDVIDQETIKHPWRQTVPASVPISKRSLWNLSLSIYCCLSKPNITIFMASKQDYRRVVPCPRYFTGGDAHQLLLFGSGACQQSVLEGADCEHAWSCPRGRSAPAGRSLRRTIRFAFTARVALLPRREDDSHFGVRKRIWQRGLRRALPFLSFHMPDLAISSFEELVSFFFFFKEKSTKQIQILRERQMFEFSMNE